MFRSLWTFGGRQETVDQKGEPQALLPPPLSHFSSGSVPDSSWASSDFMLGVGMVIIQQNTHRVVLVYDSKHKYWFFPRGRKDIGETLEQAALREAYEESGYRARLLPLVHMTRQPPSPHDREAASQPSTESIYLTFRSWQPQKLRNGEPKDAGGEYLTFWWAGQIPERAAKDFGTGMPDEQHYESHLMSIEEAMKRVWGQEVPVLQYVWACYQETLAWEGRSSKAGTSQSENLPLA